MERGKILFSILVKVTTVLGERKVVAFEVEDSQYARVFVQKCVKKHFLKLSRRFKPLNIYRVGYLSLDNYYCTVSDSALLSEEGFAFAIHITNIEKVIRNWKIDLSAGAD